MGGLNSCVKKSFLFNASSGFLCVFFFLIFSFPFYSVNEFWVYDRTQGVESIRIREFKTPESINGFFFLYKSSREERRKIFKGPEFLFDKR